MTIIELKGSQTIDAYYDFELKYLGPKAASNWTEQEDDEMDFEIIVRARFEVHAMIEIFDLELSKKDETSISELSIQKEKKVICERGAATHLAMC